MVPDADASHADPPTPEGGGDGTSPSQPLAGETGHPERMGRADKVPVRMLSDRILVQIEPGEGERLSSGGILIPATAQLGKRLSWAEVRAVGPNVRSVQDGDQVLFNPEDVYEVEVRGETFIILRERDLHAVAAERLEEGHTGLYL
jgi:chaperonin GroES